MINGAQKKTYSSSGLTDLNLLRENKYFRTLLGAYCLLMGYCEILSMREFVNKNVYDTDLTIEFLRYVKGQDIEDSNDYHVSFDVGAAIAQLQGGK